MSTFEERLGLITDQWVKSNAFLKPVSWGLERGITVKSNLQEGVEGLLSLWGISTQADLESLHKRIDDLERALERSIESESILAERITQLESHIELISQVSTEQEVIDQ